MKKIDAIKVDNVKIKSMIAILEAGRYAFHMSVSNDIDAFERVYVPVPLADQICEHFFSRDDVSFVIDCVLDESDETGRVWFEVSEVHKKT